MNRLDHRAPLVFDTRELGRRPGSMHKATRTVEAPGGLGIPVIGVPEGEAVELELRMESVVEGVLVTGGARTRVTGECVRCLEPVGQQLDADFQELFAYPDADGRQPGPVDGEEDEDGTHLIEGDLIDLEPVVRDAVVLALPLQPVCREDCRGLCPDCGARLLDDPDHHHEEAVDPRWAALQGLTVAPEERPGAGDDRANGADGADETEEN